MQYSMAIDIGTTTVKSVLWGPGPSKVAQADVEYKTIQPRPSWAQQRATDWWQGTVKAIRTVLAKSAVRPADIKVISVSSQAPTVLAVDKDGNPLHDALIWMDRRSSRDEIEILKETVGADRIYEITGNRLDSYFNLSEMLWVTRNHPEVLDKTHKFLQANAFINMKLTGEFTIDASHASICQFWDIRKRDWSDELLHAAGIDRSFMPRVEECLDVIGHVSEQCAQETGLSTSTVVLAGAVDATATAIEVGVYKEGKAAEMTGTSSCLVVGYEELVTSRNLGYLEGIYPNTVALFGAMNTAGGSLKWFRDNLFGGETPENDAYDRINKEIEAGAKDPTGIIYLPYLTGERAPIWNPDARGTFIGIHMETNRAQIERSIMEGASFALKHNLEQAYETGVQIPQLICCGGCTKSDIWLKIKASIVHKPLVIPNVNEGATGGLAYINAAYMGEYATPEEASEANFKIKKVVEPVEEWVDPYRKMYQIYKDSYNALKDQYAALARI